MTRTNLAIRTAPSRLSGPGDLIVTPADNPWTLPVTYVATVLRRSPATIRRWCAEGWYVGGLLMAKKFGGEWMIHGPRLAACIAEETLGVSEVSA